MFWFIVLLLLAGAGFYFYQKMMDIEKEIRAEQAADSGTAEVSAPPKEAAPESETVEETVVDSLIVTPAVEKMTSKAEPIADESLNLEDEILAAVNNLPGIKQTELYTSFADVSRKQIQQLLKEMDDSGKLKREKKGSSYLLYPI